MDGSHSATHSPPQACGYRHINCIISSLNKKQVILVATSSGGGVGTAPKALHGESARILRSSLRLRRYVRNSMGQRASLGGWGGTAKGTRFPYQVAGDKALPHVR